MSDKPPATKRESALAAFMEWFRTNYPGPDTLISKPDWHAPKVFRAAEYALKDVGLVQSESGLKSGERAELDRLRLLVNMPHTSDFFEAVRLEAAHQQERWGSENDEGKQPMDWFWLLGWLSGKAVKAFLSGDQDKGFHHIISSAAVLLNWHRYASGQMTAMRPGIEAPEENVRAS